MEEAGGRGQELEEPARARAREPGPVCRAGGAWLQGSVREDFGLVWWQAGAIV